MALKDVLSKTREHQRKIALGLTVGSVIAVNSLIGSCADSYPKYETVCETFQESQKWSSRNPEEAYVYTFDSKSKEEEGFFYSPKFRFFGDSTFKDKLKQGERYCIKYNKIYDRFLPHPKIDSVWLNTAEVK